MDLLNLLIKFEAGTGLIVTNISLPYEDCSNVGASKRLLARVIVTAELP